MNLKGGKTIPKHFHYTFTGFTTTGKNYEGTSYSSYWCVVSTTWAKGWEFYVTGKKSGNTVFFPGYGFRQNTGQPDYVGNRGYWLNAVPHNKGRIRYMAIAPSYVNVAVVNGSNFSIGFAARPVPENE